MLHSQGFVSTQRVSIQAPSAPTHISQFIDFWNFQNSFPVKLQCGGPTVREEDWGWSPKAIISASLTRLCPNAKGEHTSAFGTQSYESIHWFFKFSEQFSSQTTMWGRTVREEDWGWSPKAIISASLTRLWFNARWITQCRAKVLMIFFLCKNMR